MKLKLTCRKVRLLATLCVLAVVGWVPEKASAQDCPSCASSCASCGVFGFEGREEVPDTRAFPYSTIGEFVTIYSDGHFGGGTGFLVSDRVALTVGHCLYDPAHGGFPAYVEFFPGDFRVGSRIACQVGVLPQYRTIVDANPASLDAPSYDLGYMVFDRPFDGSSGGAALTRFMTLDFGSSSALPSLGDLRSAGYPSCFDGAPASAMYRTSGAAWLVLPRVFQHTLDATPGQSGSPIWIEDPTTGDPRVVALVQGGISLQCLVTLTGTATRLTAENSTTVQSWREFVSETVVLTSPTLSRTLSPGSQTTFQIDLARANTTAPFGLFVAPDSPESTLPLGIRFEFTPEQVNGAQSTLTVIAENSAPIGAVSFVVRALDLDSGTPCSAVVQSLPLSVVVAPAPGRTPPTCQITAPQEGSTVSGNITVRATATDNVSVARVEFYVGTASTPARVDTSEPYTFPFSVGMVTGPLLFRAIAFDNEGTSSTVAERRVIASPAQGTALSIEPPVDWREDLGSGDGDGIAEPGEVAAPFIFVRSAQPVTDVQFRLLVVSGGAAVRVIDGTDSRLVFQAEQLRDFEVEVLSCQSPVSFALEATYTQGGVFYSQQIPFPASIRFDCPGERLPTINFCSIDIDDPLPEGDADGRAEAGEEFRLRFSVRVPANSVPALGVRATPGPFNDPRVVVQAGFEDLSDAFPGSRTCSWPLTDTWRVNVSRDWPGGPVSADAIVLYNGAPTPIVIPGAIVIDIPARPWMRVLPRGNDFGAVAPGSVVSLATTIENQGALPLTVSGMTSMPDVAWTGPAFPFDIGPGLAVSASLQVTTAGLLPGPIARSVVFQTTAPFREGEDRVIINALLSDTFPVYPLPVAPGVSVDAFDASGRTIVWSDSSSGNFDVMGLDTAVGTPFPICVQAANQSSPKISGNIVAWNDLRNSPASPLSFDVFATNLTTGQEFPVATTAADERLVGIDDRFIVFRRSYATCSPNGTLLYNLFSFDLQTGATAQITNLTGSRTVRSNADFGNGTLAWEEATGTANGNSCSNGNRDLRMIQLVSGNSCVPNCATNLTPQILVTNPADCGVTGCSVVFENAARQIVLFRNGAPMTLTTGENRRPVIGGASCELVVYEHLVSGPSNFQLLFRDLGTGLDTLVSSVRANNPWRIDRNLLVFREVGTGRVLYSFLKEADLAVSAPDVSVSPLERTDRTPLVLSVVVRNLAPMLSSAPFTVRTLSAQGAVLSSRQVLAPVPARGTATIDLPPFLLPEGQHSLVVEVLAPSNDIPINHRASIAVTVADADTSPPMILNPTVMEFPGNGNGRIDVGEFVRFAWTTSDQAGIGNQSLSVDGVVRSEGPGPFALGPFAPGNHTWRIDVCDADDTPECSAFSGSFTVQGEPCRTDFDNDGIPSPGDLDDFITAYFSDIPGERARCDFNDDGLVEPGDIDDFITAYFDGC